MAGGADWAGEGAGAGQALTALPIRVAHLEVAAGAGGVFAAAFRAPDVLDLLAQALEGGVYLEVTVTDNIGIIGPVVAAAIVSFLLRWLGQEAEVETAAGRTRGTRRARRARGTLHREGVQGLLGSERSPGWSAMDRQGGELRTTGPASPVRPRGPGGPMGPGRPFSPSLPGAPAEPGGPCRGKMVKKIKKKTVRKHRTSPTLAEKPPHPRLVLALQLHHCCFPQPRQETFCGRNKWEGEAKGWVKLSRTFLPLL